MKGERQVDPSRQKRELRQALREQRRRLAPAEVAVLSRRIHEHLLDLPAFRAARSVALFASMEREREPDLSATAEWLRHAGRRSFYPYQRSDARGFREVTAGAPLQSGRLGFLEPAAGAAEALEEELDLILVPALAVTVDGLRLGFGSGFYDRVLPRFAPPAVAIAIVYSFQVLEGLPHEAHDARCGAVVTEQGPCAFPGAS